MEVNTAQGLGMCMGYHMDTLRHKVCHRTMDRIKMETREKKLRMALYGPILLAARLLVPWYPLAGVPFERLIPARISLQPYSPFGGIRSKYKPPVSRKGTRTLHATVIVP